MKTMLVTLAAAAALAGPASAQQPVTPAQQIIRPEDSALTCVQIADEAAQLSQAMGGNPGNSTISSLTDVAKAGASTFIPFAGLVIAGADALTQGDRDRRIAEALARQNRWFYLNGLYAGNDCMADAAPPAPAVTPAPAAAAPVPPPAPVQPPAAPPLPANQPG
ncbi:hypothetical protein [Brevundimonas lenta]|uniref:Uncharacterized protein n=1 Tax=Brevundimonas lenta TaxID=424796 RepID=A0A7W6JBW9_9CAUL|nr:hypothetical protein [Brevundimonas lenta]MBB4082269.1 hypothetical protein [Brevundimonas lenta]